MLLPRLHALASQNCHTHAIGMILPLAERQANHPSSCDPITERFPLLSKSELAITLTLAWETSATLSTSRLDHAGCTPDSEPGFALISKNRESAAAGEPSGSMPSQGALSPDRGLRFTASHQAPVGRRMGMWNMRE